MSGGYDNTNRGALFKNDRKETDNHPDYSGSVNVEGVEYFFNGWIKTAGPSARNPGSKFMSVSVSKKRDQPAPRAAPSPSFDDDDIPF
jgi:hypothetical protein